MDSTLAQDVAQFLQETPYEDWDDIWWSDVLPYLPIEDAISAARIYVDLANAYEDFTEHVQVQVQQSNNPLTAEEKINQILSRPQVAQRTEEWYVQGLQYLTASQFGTLYASPRTRGQLVLEKSGVNPVERRGQRLVTPSDFMSPFDWGIRFEPVIRDIYSAITNTTVVDVGRLYHNTLPYLAASPDGLVVEDKSRERLGRLVEYKAPVTRKLIQKIPGEYYMQMQIQMEVADIDRCDYCEMKFYSRYNDKMLEPPAKPVHYRGYIAIIMKDGVLDRYEYSPLNPPDDWTYLVEEDGPNERVYELIPWWIEDYYMETVVRDKAWFARTIPIMDSFWHDVEEARAGRFVLPAKKVSLTKKRPATSALAIMDEDDDNLMND